ncbi:MAG: DUF134 domain-containing protein [Patescibacteria group bacterium]|nr:DUF134 domain-containing protein [Patescibacteria group bacterium]
MGRPHKFRRINFNPTATYFKPQGIPLRALQEIELGSDKLEAIRLKYVARLDQVQCAKKMRVSQSTFQRILVSANQKIAEALTTGKAIKIIRN